MPSRSFPHRYMSVTFPSFALLSSPFDLANYHVISLKPSSRDYSITTIENYPLPHEHRILPSSPNSTSVSPPPSHPPILNSGAKQNTPRQEDTLTTIISKVLNKSGTHLPPRQSRFTILPMISSDITLLPRRIRRGQLSTG